MLQDYFGFKTRRIELITPASSLFIKEDHITGILPILREDFNNIDLSNQNINCQSNNSISMGKSSLQNQSDEEVLFAFQKGNKLALEIIYDRYGSLVYRIIYRMLNNHQEAEDLTQEIFIILQQKCN